ncbi:transporter substrate-binding domain-containing protein [Butyrivibrio sp. YAB3001]|uniref:transporter substrate-binding domain-containing protein n=1 Tax=Butyrivibrio sp. YAB3001 TaxID=1520812 RepID=UPI0008F629B7|nr:transporter substrate-binding domain-containing protein [Butyrivibrio sp. YAB3001]SFB70651.1 Response regulator receiver domain-containing protein [Butyrivibrio sp. YAB3001]
MKFRFTNWVLLTSLALCCFFGLPIHVRAYNPQSRVVRIGYYENEVFEAGASEGAVKSGYAYEYYRKLSEYTGWEYEYVYGNFVEVYNMLLKGEVDMVAGLALTEERKKIFFYPEIPMGTESYSLVKHDYDNNITSDESTFNDKKIGVLDSAVEDTLNDYLTANKIKAEVVPFSDYETLFDAFDKNELDIMAAETDGTYERHHAAVISSFGSNDYYICVNLKKPELLMELNAAQNQLYLDNPDYASFLRNKYFAVSLTSRAFSPPEQKWLAENKEISVGYLNNYLPYSDTDKNGETVGIIKYIFTDIFKALSVDVAVSSYKGYDNYEDMIAAVSSGEIDVAFPVGGGLFYSEEDGIYLSNPVIASNPNMIYGGKLSEQKTYDFAVNANNNMQYYYIKNNYPDSSISFYNSTEECLEAVVEGKAICTTLNGLRTNDILKNRAYKSLSFRQLQKSDDRCLGVKIGNEGLLKLLNRGLNVKGQEYAVNLAYKYSQDLYQYTLLDAIIDNIWIIIVLSFAVILMILLFLYMDRSRKIKEVKEKEYEKKEFEKANNSKTLFLNKISEDMHDMITNIIKDAESYSGTESLARIKDSCNHLMWLLDDIHNFSSVESGQSTENNDNVNLKKLFMDMRSMSEDEAKKLLASYDLNGKRILIVASSKAAQFKAAEVLKWAGLEVQTANNGKEAVDIIKAAPYGYFDYILVNIQDPNIDGYEASRQIRNLDDREKAVIPIVAVAINVFDNAEAVG